MPTSVKPISSTPFIHSVQSAFKLLESIHFLGLATLSQLSVQTGFSLNQTFRLLATLEHEGYVSKDTAKRYRLGSKLHVLGEGADWPHDLISVARPHMQALSDLSGETILLSVPTGLERMIVAQLASTHSLQVNYPIGSRVPLYVGGMGVAMLAFLKNLQAEVFAKPFVAFTDVTLDEKALKVELKKVRQARVRVSKDDYMAGEFSVASPIVDRTQKAIAAITIAGFSARLHDSNLKLYMQTVKEVAVRISEAVTEVGLH